MATLKNTAVNDSGYMQLPSGTIAQRPANPVIGMMRYNSELLTIEAYGATGWVTVTNLGISWNSFYDFRQITSATTGYRYDDGIISAPSATASYSSPTLVRRTASISGATCAGIAQLYSDALNYARLQRSVSYPSMTIMQLVYKPTGGFTPDATGGLLAMGMNFGNATWNVQTDSYRDGSSGDAWAFSVGGDYTSGTRFKGTAWPTTQGLYTLFTVYDGVNVYRYINASAGDTVSSIPYITITPGTGTLTYYGILDAMAYGTSYSDGETFWSCAAVWNKVLTVPQMNSLASNRVRLASDTTYFGSV
jgi:hypothetical protein